MSPAGPASRPSVHDRYSPDPGNACDSLFPRKQFSTPVSKLGRSCGYSEGCDDTNWGVNPAANEICDGKDDNCDGVLPPEENDEDEDGWFVCAGDCDDKSFYSYPGATERLDLKDNDCDGAAEGAVLLNAASAVRRRANAKSPQLARNPA